MASYDIFTQPQGANINTSLFPSAASAGVQAGNAVPSITSSIIQGGLKGIQQGQEIASNALTIEQQQINNERNQIRLERERELEELQTDAERAKLEDEKLKLTQDKTLRTRKQEFEELFRISDPLTQKQLLLGGDYADVFAADPNLYKFSLQAVSGSMSPDELRQATSAFQKYGTNNYYDRKLAENQNKLELLTSQLTADDTIQSAAQQSGLTPEQIPYKVEIVPAGKYEYDENGNVVIDDKTRQKKVSRDYLPGTKPTSFEFIYKNKRIQEDVSPELVKSIRGARGLQGYVDGAYKKRALTQLERDQKATQAAPANRQAQAQQAADEQAYAPEPELEVGVRPNPNALYSITGVPVITKSSGQINLSQNPKAFKVAQAAVGLPDDDFAKIKPDVQKLFQTVESGPQGWFGNLSTAQVEDVSAAKKRISDAVSAKAFETTPELKDQYNEALVAEHNEIVDQFEEQLLNPFSMGTGATAGVLASKDLSQMVRVDTPLELYQLRQYKSHDELLQQMMDKFAMQIRQAKAVREKRGMQVGSMLSALNSPVKK